MDDGSWWSLARVHYEAGDVLAATGIREEMRAKDPTFFDHLLAGFCYAAAGRVADALHEADLAVGPSNLMARVGRAGLFGVLGKPAEAAQLVKEMELLGTSTYVPGHWGAALDSVLGEKTKALDLLDREFKDGDRTLWLEYPLPQFDPIRNEPRFAALLKRYGLPTVGTVRLVATPHALEGPKGRPGVPA